MPGYEPMEWVTEFEVADFIAALAYLKSRPHAHPIGVGLFGISKGAGAGLLAAANDPYVSLFRNRRSLFPAYHGGPIHAKVGRHL